MGSVIDYSKWDKMKFSSSEDEDGDCDDDMVGCNVDGEEENFSAKAHGDGSIQMQDLIQTLTDKTSWASSLSEKERYEWLVDCYRMRVDDDYAWGGGNLHGLYEPEPMDGKKMTIVKDFLIFLKLAVKNGVIPESYCFSFGECLKEAAELLPYAFEKSDAKDKWGGENVFSARPSLRRTAEAIYGTSCLSYAETKDDAVKLYDKVQTEIENGVRKAFQKSNKELFAEVGGFDLWYKLHRTIKFNG